jgi:hypothetical protein
MKTYWIGYETTEKPKEPIFERNSPMQNDSLDRLYQEGFKDLKEDDVCPPCPNCKGEMVPWDAWLVTGAKCKECGWNMSEGSGCLL